MKHYFFDRHLSAYFEFDEVNALALVLQVDLLRESTRRLSKIVVINGLAVQVGDGHIHGRIAREGGFQLELAAVWIWEQPQLIVHRRSDAHQAVDVNLNRGGIGAAVIDRNQGHGVTAVAGSGVIVAWGTLRRGTAVSKIPSHGIAGRAVDELYDRTVGRVGTANCDRQSALRHENAVTTHASVVVDTLHPVSGNGSHANRRS